MRQIVQNLKSDGLMPTIDAVFKRLDEPLPLGYCNAGVVLPKQGRACFQNFLDRA